MADLTKIIGLIGKIQVKSIADTLLRSTLILFSFVVICAIFKVNMWIIITLFVFSGISFFFFLGMYLYFSIKNPDYLRSETFQLKKQSIEILGDKDNSLNPNISEIKYVSNSFENNNQNENKPL
jgi:Ca2+/Na+ antiporter